MTGGVAGAFLCPWTRAACGEGSEMQVQSVRCHGERNDTDRRVVISPQARPRLACFVS